MSEESQYILEAGDIAPKPSAVRRSGKISYVRKSRIVRPGLDPPANRRMVEQRQNGQHEQEHQERPERLKEREIPSKLQNPTPEPLLNALAGKVKSNDAEGAKRQVADESMDENVPEATEGEVNLRNSDTSKVSIDDIRAGYENQPEQSAQESMKNSILVEKEAVSAFMSTFHNAEEECGEEQIETSVENNKSTVTVEKEEATPKASGNGESPYKKKTRARVYHRPHTNQTVVVGSNNNDDNDSKSTASGLSQPSWRRVLAEEDDKDELSQTSIGNSKRRARMTKRKKKNVKHARKKYQPGDSRNSNMMGYVVSQAFDKMLGYAGGHHNYTEDGYSSEESEGIMTDLQEAILTTFGCSVPQPKPMKKQQIEDDITIESNLTGGQSRHSKRHIRSDSNLSGSMLSTVSGSNVESVLSFDTTEELADFSNNKRNQSTSYKVPDVYDPEPPKIVQEKEIHSVYSDDLYSNIREPDFEPVNLLEEGDTILDSMGKDLLNVANSKVDEVFTSIGSLLGGPTATKPMETEDQVTKSKSIETDNHTQNVVLKTTDDSPDHPEKKDVLNTTGNTTVTASSSITEPLEVIKENDTEGGGAKGFLAENNANHSRKGLNDTADDGDFMDFEDRFEINVFETFESAKESVVKTDIRSVAALSEEQDSKAAESDASVFEGIDEEKSISKDRTESSLVMKLSENKSSLDDNDDDEDRIIFKEVPETEDGEEEKEFNTSLTSPQNDDVSITVSIKKQGTGTTTSTETSSDKTVTDPITVDREFSIPAVVSENKAKDVVTPASPASVLSKPERVAIQTKPLEEKSTTPLDKKSIKVSSKPVAQEPQNKKSKKFGGFKGLIRSFKKKKGKRKSNTAPLAAELAETHLDDPDKNSFQPESQEKIETSSSPALQVTQSISSPNVDDNSAPEEARPEEKVADVETPTLEDQHNPLTIDDSSWVDFNDAKSSGAANKLLSRPTTPVSREPDSTLDTPKMSNLGLEDRQMTRPVSGTNLADLPGIDEVKSFREDPPARSYEETEELVISKSQPDPPATATPTMNTSIQNNNRDGFGVPFDTGHVFDNTTSIETAETKVTQLSFYNADDELKFDGFNLDGFKISGETWESFGDNSDDVGAAAYRQKALEDTKKSPDKVSAFPMAPLLAEI